MAKLFNPNNPALIVDDNATAIASYEAVLKTAGIRNVLVFRQPLKVLAELQRREVSLIIMDPWLANMDGEAFLERLIADHPEIPLIIVTALEHIEAATRNTRNGVIPHFLKPVDPDLLAKAIRCHGQALQHAVKKASLDRQRIRAEALEGFYAQNPTMLAQIEYLESVAPSEQPVLITGETGTGKELAARAVHRFSRVPGEFVAVNVAGVDDLAFSDTLFGHKRGAFTGAIQDRPGLVAKAARGTLFLDEIGDLTLASQAKLLRLVQEQEYYALGSDFTCRSSARIIVATNRDLPALMRKEKFRKDLYYRLRTHHVHLPPLRQRPEDLEGLFRRFVGQAAGELGKPVPILAPAWLPLLHRHTFPGNVRELKALAHDAVGRSSQPVLAPDQIQEVLADEWMEPEFSELLVKAMPAAAPRDNPFSSLFEIPKVVQVQSWLAEEAMLRASGNQTAAALLLGITRQTLRKWLDISASAGGSPPVTSGAAVQVMAAQDTWTASSHLAGAKDLSVRGAPITAPS